MSNSKKYRLTRINDGLVKEAKSVAFVKKDRDGSFSVLRKPEKMATCSIYNSLEQMWKTSMITDFNIIDDDNMEFTTINSKYKLEKL